MPTSLFRSVFRKLIAIKGDNLDWPHFERWCDEHGSRPLLEEIRAELRRKSF
jgi:hypothetical protein